MHANPHIHIYIDMHTLQNILHAFPCLSRAPSRGSHVCGLDAVLLHLSHQNTLCLGFLNLICGFCVMIDASMPDMCSSEFLLKFRSLKGREQNRKSHKKCAHLWLRVRMEETCTCLLTSKAKDKRYINTTGIHMHKHTCAHTPLRGSGPVCPL